ncbi:uncharacterized protein LOC142339108 [Convolutriloba macropyga]|uniref:uncharacterized protein LOC142339108 n=1 Tax=Convolutriloba macropyga TaxID=536237 RepID=UPI003F51EEBC
MGSTEQFEPNFDSSLLSETTFVTPNADCSECYSILRNVQNLNQHNTFDFIDSQDSFDILDNHFVYCDQNNVKLLHGKGFYPYSCMDTFRKFKLKKLPPKKFWVDKIKSGKVTITEGDYEKAKLIFENLYCRNMGDYHFLYLTDNTLQLAYWFAWLRAVCLDSYSLDCAQYLSAPHLAGDAFLKICHYDLELLTDRNHLDLAEEWFRGGMSSLYTKRLCTPNKKYLERFDDTQKSTCGLTIHANNLYGGFMKDFRLPLSSFQTDTEVTIEQVLQTPDDAEFGYIVCVDVDYPDSIYDAHEDFPLAPTREPVDSMWLSSYQLDLLEERHLPKVSNCNKLLQTLYDEKDYTLHYVTLNNYDRNSLKVSKLRKVLKFRQSKWMAKYIELKTRLRQAATSKIAENFKLMNNSAFGKCRESTRNRVNAFRVRDERFLLNHKDKFKMESFKIFDGNMAVVTTRKTKINWVKPTIVGG